MRDINDYIRVDEKVNKNGTVTITATMVLGPFEDASKMKSRKLRGEQARDRFRRLAQAYVGANGAAVSLADV